MSKHHKTKSPSSMPAKNLCVHYESEDFAGEPAQKGITLHKIFENKLTKGKLTLSEADIQELVEKDGVHPDIISGLEEDDVSGLIWAESALDEIISKEFPDLNKGAAELVQSGEAFAERRLPILDENFDELNFGTIDFTYKHILSDLKTGRVRNYREQMENYSLALFQEDPLLEKVLVVELYSKEEKVIAYELTLQECEESIFSLSKRIDNKENELRVQNDYCKWCAARTTCPKLRGSVAQIQENREEFPKDFSFSSSETCSRAIASLQAWRSDPDDEELRQELVKESENLAFLWEAASAAESFFEGVKAMIKKAISEGVVIEGLVTTTKAGKAKVTDTQKVFEISPHSSEEFLKLVSIGLSDYSKSFDKAEQVEQMFETAGIEFPDDLKGARGKLTKANISKAIRFLFSNLGILEEADRSLTIKRVKNSSSLREGDKLPESAEGLK